MRVFVVDALEVMWVVKMPDGISCETMPASPELLELLLDEEGWCAVALRMLSVVPGSPTTRERIAWTESASS